MSQRSPRPPAWWAALCLTLAASCSHAPPTTWMPVTRGDLVLGVEVSGALEAIDSTPVKPPPISDTWNFKIARMADEGSVVASGAPVVGFDASDMMRKLQDMQNQAQAAAVQVDKQRGDAAMARKDDQLAVAQAEAAVRKAELVADQPDDLTAQVALKTAQLDRTLAQTELEHTRARADQNRRHDQAALASLVESRDYYQGRVREIQRDIARMTVRAPRAGTVIYPTNWRGDKKKVGDSAWRMETVVEVVSLDRMIGRGKIDEVDASRVHDGQPVTLRLDAHPDTELVGHVDSIATTFEPRSPTNPARIVKLKIALDKTGGLSLRPGMRFRGRVETDRVRDAVLVPAPAVFVTAGGPVAYRKTGRGYQRVTLKLGRRNDTSVEVLKGLAPGDQVSRVDLGGGQP